LAVPRGFAPVFPLWNPSDRLPQVIAGGPNAGAHFKPGWNGLARTPPLGWRSWNTFGGLQNNQPGIDKITIEASIDAVVKQRPNPYGNRTISLCDLGFCSVGIDEGWEQCTLPKLSNVTVCEHLGQPTGKCDGNSYCCPWPAGNKDHYCTQHNAAGDPMINSLFAGFKGMKAQVDYGHSRNVSMGWYMAGCKCWDIDQRHVTVERDVVVTSQP